MLSGITDYTRVDVAHLMRRAGFGGSKAQIDALMTQPTWAAVVDQVLDTTTNPVDTIPAAVDDLVEEYYQPWVVSMHYWMNRMATSPTPIVEKMTLFWHGHLTSSIDDALPRLMHRQIKTWRANALGNAHTLYQAMAVDPAMLIYLNNASNVAREPNENFARELMELFTLGNAQFTEAEVIDMARAWTGYNLAEDQEHHQYWPDDHDNGLKTLFGITKNWDGPAAITEILTGARQAQFARFLTTKIWSFFAYPNPASTLVDDLAAAFVAGGLNIKALLRVIFLRPEFRDAATRTALVRTPIEWMVATMRATGFDAETMHPEWWIERLGQIMYGPPNVSGWRQNGAWISSSAQWGKGSYAGWVRWKANEANLFAGAGDLTAAAAAQAVFDRFGIDDPSAVTRQAIEAYVTGEQAADRRWAIPPNLTALGMLSPDFQLA